MPGLRWYPLNRVSSSQRRQVKLSLPGIPSKLNVLCPNISTLPLSGAAVGPEVQGPGVKASALRLRSPPPWPWVPSTMMWPDLSSSHVPSFLSLSACVSSSLPEARSLMMLPLLKAPVLWDHTAEGCQHWLRLGPASASDLSPPSGHCWPSFKGISQVQPRSHPWGSRL